MRTILFYYIPSVRTTTWQQMNYAVAPYVLRRDIMGTTLWVRAYYGVAQYYLLRYIIVPRRNMHITRSVKTVVNQMIKKLIKLFWQKDSFSFLIQS